MIRYFAAGIAAFALTAGVAFAQDNYSTTTTTTVTRSDVPPGPNPGSNAVSGGMSGAALGAAIGCVVTIPIGCVPGAAVGAAVGGGLAPSLGLPRHHRHRPPITLRHRPRLRATRLAPAATEVRSYRG